MNAETPSLAARGRAMDIALPIAGLIRWRSAFRQFLVRAIARRYRGSALGFVWSLAVPLATLGIYGFVFGTVMQSRWDAGSGAPVDFTLNLFAGLLVFWLMADALTQAPSVIIEHANLVKKAVFPLEILPAVAVGNAAFHAAVNAGVLIAGMVIMGHQLSVTILWLPIVLLPFAILITGIAWLLSALGVFFRDLMPLIGLALTGALFLSPVFYPISRLPPAVADWIQFNPITEVVDQVRCVMLEGRAPEFDALAIYLIVAWIVAGCGLAVFRRLRDSFADVL